MPSPECLHGGRNRPATSLGRDIAGSRVASGKLSLYATVAVREARSMQHTIPTPVETAHALIGSVDPIYLWTSTERHDAVATLLETGIRSSLSFPAEGTYFSSFNYVARTHRAPRHR